MIIALFVENSYSQNSNIPNYVISSGLITGKSQQSSLTMITGQTVIGQTQSNKTNADFGFLHKILAKPSVVEGEPLNSSLSSIYPNPATNYVNIKCSGYMNETINLKIINSAGEDVNYNYELNSDNIQINTELLPSGTYRFQLFRNNQVETGSFEVIR